MICLGVVIHSLLQINTVAAFASSMISPADTPNFLSNVFFFILLILLMYHERYACSPQPTARACDVNKTSTVLALPFSSFGTSNRKTLKPQQQSLGPS